MNKKPRTPAIWFCMALTLFLTALAPWAGASQSEKPAVYYFFESYCDSCHPEIGFREEFRRLTGRKLEEYQYTYGNVAKAAGRIRYEKTLEEFSVPSDQQLLPLAIVDGQVYAGSKAISNALPRAFVESADDENSLIYYLYAPACASCAQVEEKLSLLGDSTRVTRGEYSFDSPIILKKVNIYEAPDIAQALFERYLVPEDERYVPIMFMGTRYFPGVSAISSALKLVLPAGGAIGTPLVADQASSSADAAGWTGLLAAGLLAGLDPSALGMLLFFLTLLVSANTRASCLAALFLCAQFLTYLLLGALLYWLFGALKPALASMAGKTALTVLYAAVAALNLRDAWTARRGDCAKVRNQLPAGLHRFLHSRIQGTVGGASPWMGASVFALGVVVACGEFLCTGTTVPCFARHS